MFVGAASMIPVQKFSLGSVSWNLAGHNSTTDTQDTKS